MELNRRTKTLIITLAISLFLLIIGILIGDIGIIGNFIILSVFIVSIPQVLMSYIEYRDIKDMEAKFPFFLRDLTESIRSGMPLHKAVINAGKVDYGKLSKEVKKMAHQLTWGVNIIKVFEQAEKRLKQSEIMSKNMRIIIETYKTGGEIDKTLDSISNAILTIQETQNERKSMLNQYVVAMYAITYIFIGIIVGISKLLIPIFSSSTGASIGALGTIMGNPCESCLYMPSGSCFPCYIYFNICTLLGTNKETIGCYYLGLFFSMIIVQSICSGLVAGQISEGSIRAGIKHSMIMLTTSFGIIFILVKLKMLGV
ncbi:MAG: type II secretion system F family protein [Candidatus Aenigmarchaeota archaeon]|nr:type II secretion system F family protein [Candidatus Aenigmarchaeota archaeon]MBU5689199.1 type II secretion system F family protein [Candidatus Aenigmarchaeota archaeon]